MANNTPTPLAADQNLPFGDELLAANFSNPKQRQDKEFGRKLISRIYREQASTTSTMFWGGRAARWKENELWAKGMQPMQEFIDMNSIDGNKSWNNLDYTQNKQGAQFVETLVSSIGANDEYPCVKAVDASSMTEKEEEKKDALFRMHDKEAIMQAQEQAGVALEAPTAYVPEDEISAEVYFQLEYLLPKEIEFQKFCAKTLTDNQYKLSLKRQLIRNLVVNNFGALKVERLHDGFIGLRKGVPANMIYNFFMNDSGKMELSYIGDIYSLKVRDLRRKYGKSESNPNGLSEKEIFDMCKSAKRVNVANRFNYNWSDSYLYTTDRPYDDYSILVFDCEVKLFDTDYYVSKTDNFGRENIQAKKNIPQPTSDRAKVLSTDKFTVYRGIWSVDCDKMVYWGYPDVVIKPYMDISESLFSWSIVIPNNDGDYVPSLFERALEPLRELTLAKLKRKQIIAEMVPPGYSLDVEKCRDIDLGSGNIMSLQDVLKMRNQKGVVVWSSRGVNPNEINPKPPIEGLPNADSVPQLQELSAVIDRCIADIRALVGVPVYRDGTDVGDRTAAKLAEGQNQSSFNVTDFIPAGLSQLLEETLQKVCMIKWDDVVLKEGRTEMMDTRFEVKVQMRPTAYEKQLLEQNIQTGMQQVDSSGKPLISFKDAFVLRNIDDPKLAELYLGNMIEQNRKQAMEESAHLQELNQKVQQASAQQKAESDAQLLQQKAQMDAMMKDAESKNKKQEILLQGFMETLKAGVPIPPQLIPLMNATFQNVGIPLVAQNDEMAKELQAKMQEEAMAAEQQAQQMEQINQIAAENNMHPEEVMQAMQQEQAQEGGQPEMQPESQMQ